MPAWNPRANEIFLQAAGIVAPDERRAFLDIQCAEDKALRGEVESLLAANATAGDFLELPIVAVESDMRRGRSPAGFASTAAMTASSEQPGTQIGRYKLRELIGEGGMGTVWIAEQTEPVRRKVALKLVKPGMDTKEVLSRFGVERQALALMDHPNIAKVHDGGVTATGRPFFVMEYVKGIPITQYCDEAKLTVQDRLALFVQVCQAVQHAHQKGIIHRDLKPSNILVCLYDGRPIPKIIDFGLAKAMHQPLTENTLYTAHGMMVGTPLYMSPEQAEFNNLDVDTRTDIYSLGVVLYELLTGTTPLERKRFKDAALQEILRLIKDEDPQKPSTKISGSGALPTIAAQRGLEPPQLSRVVQGDLDWIAMKALEKDRSRRYESASGLARDVQRYLDDEPVEACPPSLGYKLRKLARRNQRAIATAGLLATVVLAALAVVAGSVGWAMRDRQNRQAVVERQIVAALDEVAAALQSNRLSEAEAALKQSLNLQMTIETRPEVAAAVKRWKTDLSIALRLADIERGGVSGADGSVPGSAQAAAYRKVLDDYGLDLNSDNLDHNAEIIRTSPIQSQLLTAIYDGALSLTLPDSTAFAGDYPRLREQWQRLAAKVDKDPWRSTLRDAVQREDDVALLQLAKDDAWQRQPPVLVALLGERLIEVGEQDASEVMLKAAAQRYPKNFRLNRALGIVFSYYVPSEVAERHFRACVEERPENAEVRARLGSALAFSDRIYEGETELREAIRLQPACVAAHSGLGAVLSTLSRLPDAEVAFRRAMELDPTDYYIGEQLLKILLDRGDTANAIATFELMVKRFPDSAPAHFCLGNAFLKQEHWADAERAFREARRLDRKSLAPLLALGQVLESQSKVTEADAAFREAVKHSPEDPDAHLALSAFLERQARWTESKAAYQEAVRLDPESITTLNLEKLAELGVELERNPEATGLLLKRGLEFARGGDRQRAKADFTRALDGAPLVGPDSLSGEIVEAGKIWHDTGIFLYQWGERSEAERALQLSLNLLEPRLRENPYDGDEFKTLAELYVYLGSISDQSLRKAESKQQFARALILDSRSAIAAHRNLGNLHLKAAEWDAGAAHLAIVVENRVEDHLLAMQTAVLQLYRGDRDGYEHACRRMLDLYHHTKDPLEADRTAKACLLYNPPFGDLATLTKLAKSANADPKHWAYRYFILVEALAAYRGGNWQPALDSCQKGRAGIRQAADNKEATYYDIPILGAHYLVVQAMAEHRLGMEKAAVSSLGQARTIVQREFPEAPAKLDFRWADWMLYEVLCREAEHVMGLDARNKVLPGEPCAGLRNSGHADSDWSCINGSKPERPACPPACCITPATFAATRSPRLSSTAA